MKWLLIVVTCAALIAPAFADDTTSTSSHGGRHRKAEQKTDTTAKVRADDKAYKAALDRVPGPTQKYDPWGMTRSTGDKH